MVRGFVLSAGMLCAVLISGQVHAAMVSDTFDDNVVNTSIWNNSHGWTESVGILAASKESSFSWAYPNKIATIETFQDFVMNVDINFLTHGMNSDMNGLLFRQNENNYYNIMLYPRVGGTDLIDLYKFENGIGIQLLRHTITYNFPDVGTWMTAKLNVKGDRFQFELWTRDLLSNYLVDSFDVTDASISGPGSVGMWNYRNTESRYDNFSVTESAPVPEPATMLLFGSGLAGLAGFRMMSKKS